MHILTVCYGHPSDPAAFDAYYQATHTPLVQKLGGLESFTARHCASLDGSQPPYFLIAELGFAIRRRWPRRCGRRKAGRPRPTSPSSPTAG